MDMATLHARQCQHIRSNPQFQQLVAQRATLAWSLSLVTLVIYYAFMMTVVLAPNWLHEPLTEGAVLSRGIPLGASVIFISWLLTALYVLHANARFDRISDALIMEAQA